VLDSSVYLFKFIFAPRSRNSLEALQRQRDRESNLSYIKAKKRFITLKNQTLRLIFQTFFVAKVLSTIKREKFFLGAFNLLRGISLCKFNHSWDAEIDNY